MLKGRKVAPGVVLKIVPATDRDLAGSAENRRDRSLQAGAARWSAMPVAPAALPARSDRTARARSRSQPATATSPANRARAMSISLRPRPPRRGGRRGHHDRGPDPGPAAPLFDAGKPVAKASEASSRSSQAQAGTTARVSRAESGSSDRTTSTPT